MGSIRFDLAACWRALGDAHMAEIRAWRPQPPKATLQEFEAAVDDSLAALRRRMLHDMAMARQGADLSPVSALERPPCPRCGMPGNPVGCASDR
jgi:hypothetical protein